MKSRISPLQVVYVAQAPWDSGLAGRVGRRRAANGVNTFTYRAVDGTVTYLADKALSGTAPPTSSQAMSPDDAIEFVRTRLAIPTHRSHDWSDGWDFATSAWSASGENISLNGLTGAQVDAFKERAAGPSRRRSSGSLPASTWRPRRCGRSSVSDWSR